METRFLLTRECPVLDSVKKQIAEAATGLDTALMPRSYTNTTRVYRTARTRSDIAREKTGAPAACQPWLSRPPAPSFFIRRPLLWGRRFIDGKATEEYN